MTSEKNELINSGTITPIFKDCFCNSFLAIGLGRYPISFAFRKTSSRVSFLMPYLSLKARDTVATEISSARAISFMVMYCIRSTLGFTEKIIQGGKIQTIQERKNHQYQNS